MKSLRVFTRSQFMRTARQHNAVVRSDSCRTGIRQTVLFDVSTGYISIATQVATHLTVPKNDPYLPIHHATFMALRFVLRPFLCQNFLSPKILIVSDLFPTKKVGKS